MTSLLLFLLGIIAVPTIPAFLPRRFRGFGFGIVALITGLFLLDQHTRPFGESEDRFGFGALISMLWIGGALLSFAISSARDLLGSVDSGADTQQKRRFFTWHVPLGILVGVLALHWLSNRLAGATPAWLVHMLVLGATFGAGMWLRRASPTDRRWADLSRAATVTCFTIAALVAKFALEAPVWATMAKEAAGGQPFCLLTFAGRDHPRAATSMFDLSPLVSRSGGRSFVDDAYWLVVEEDGVARAKRWSDPLGPMEVIHSASRPAPASCRPRQGGNL